MDHKVIIIFCSFLLSACGTLVTSSEVFFASKIEKDKYRNIVIIEGPMIFQARGIGGYQVSLKAKKRHDNQISYFVFVQDSRATNWRFYEQAYDNNGHNFEFEYIGSDVTLGVTSETFAIHLTRQYLDESVSNSIDLKVFGSDAELPIQLSGYYVQGFLKKVDEFLVK